MDASYVLESVRKESDKDQSKRIAFFILVILTIIQQMPVIKNMFYGQIRIILYIGFGLFSCISLFSINKFLRIGFVRYLISTIIYSCALFSIATLLKNNSANIFELLVPFGVLICSLNTNFRKRELSNLLILYVILSVILGISSIFYYGEGFTITQIYFLRDKNQIGPLLGISAIITGIWILNKKQFDLRINNIVFRVIVFILLIASILIIRNRAGLLGISITMIIVILKEFKFRWTIKNLLIVQLILLILIIGFFLGAFNGIVETISKSLFLNYDLTDLNSISAGRTDVYKMSLEFIMGHPMLGELGAENFIYSIPHNYILNKWVNYGIIGSFPLVLFYLYLWVFTLKHIFKNGSRMGYSLPVWVLMFSLIVSLFEYTYPYGPGVSQLMVWFLLGQYLRYNYS